MDVVTYLRLVREPYAIFTREDHPSELASLFKLYDDMLEHFESDLGDALELVTVQSPKRFCTQLVETSRPYIVLELQEINRISQVMEFFALLDIDVDAPISYFHALCIEYHQKFEFIGAIALKNGHEIELSTLITDEIRMAHRSPLFHRLSSSDLLEPFCQLENFQAAFEVVPAFLIAHEIAHADFAQISLNEDFDLEGMLSKIEREHKGKGYFRHLINGGGLDLTSRLLEEIYCDLVAVEMAYKVCVHRHWLDERLFSFVLIQMYNAFFYQLLLQGSTDKHRFDELRIRKGWAIIFALDFFASEKKAAHLYADYECYLGLLDTYCASLAVTLKRRSAEQRPKRSAGPMPNLSAEQRSAADDYLKVNLRDYASREFFKAPTIIPGMLGEMSKLGRRIGAGKSII